MLETLLKEMEEMELSASFVKLLDREHERLVITKLRRSSGVLWCYCCARCGEFVLSSRFHLFERVGGVRYCGPLFFLSIHFIPTQRVGCLSVPNPSLV